MGNGRMLLQAAKYTKPIATTCDSWSRITECVLLGTTERFCNCLIPMLHTCILNVKTHLPTNPCSMDK